jgi:hypothetical protein
MARHARLACLALLAGVVVCSADARTARAADDISIQPFSVEWLNAPYANAVYESADHADGIFVLSAFQNACAPCDANEANVDALAADYAAEPRVQVLDLGLEAGDDAVTAWVNRHTPNHPVVRDDEPYIWEELELDRIPAVAVVNCMGAVRYRHTGIWDDAAKAAVRAAVDALLGESCYHEH